MPVILPQSSWSTWLDLTTDLESLGSLMEASEAEPLQAHPVSTLVNSPRNDVPACVEPHE